MNPRPEMIGNKYIGYSAYAYNLTGVYIIHSKNLSYSNPIEAEDRLLA